MSSVINCNIMIDTALTEIGKLAILCGSSINNPNNWNACDETIFTELQHFDSKQSALNYIYDENNDVEGQGLITDLYESVDIFPMGIFDANTIRTNDKVSQGLKTTSQITFKPDIFTTVLTDSEFNELYVRSSTVGFKQVPNFIPKQDVAEICKVIMHNPNTASRRYLANRLLKHEYFSEPCTIKQALKYIDNVTILCQKRFIVDKDCNCIEIQNPIPLSRLASKVAARKFKCKRDITRLTEQLTLSSIDVDNLNLDFYFMCRIKQARAELRKTLRLEAQKAKKSKASKR